jgi:1-acyl-sn-glycerol-3-phosphate acyltransferase
VGMHMQILTSPLVSGAETLPDAAAEPRRPILFVGNHTLFGLYDSPILVYELFLRGFHARGLAHPAHWTSGVGPVFERYGNVKSSKFAAYRLLKVCIIALLLLQFFFNSQRITMRWV